MTSASHPERREGSPCSFGLASDLCLHAPLAYESVQDSLCQHRAAHVALAHKQYLGLCAAAVLLYPLLVPWGRSEGCLYKDAAGIYLLCAGIPWYSLRKRLGSSPAGPDTQATVGETGTMTSGLKLECSAQECSCVCTQYHEASTKDFHEGQPTFVSDAQKTNLWLFLMCDKPWKREKGVLIDRCVEQPWTLGA